MHYHHITTATFLSRPNRFIAQVRLFDGTEETVHVKNTGLDGARNFLFRVALFILKNLKIPIEKLCTIWWRWKNATTKFLIGKIILRLF